MSIGLHEKALSDIRARRDQYRSEVLRGAPKTFEKYRESVARIEELEAVEAIFLDLMRKVFTSEGDDE